MTAAWRIWRDANYGASQRCWGWPMNARKSKDWRRRAGTYRCKERSVTGIGISQSRRRENRRRPEDGFSV